MPFHEIPFHEIPFHEMPFHEMPVGCAECADVATGRAVALWTFIVEALAEPTATPVIAAATVPTTVACRSPRRSLPEPLVWCVIWSDPFVAVGNTCISKIDLRGERP